MHGEHNHAKHECVPGFLSFNHLRHKLIQGEYSATSAVSIDGHSCRFKPERLNADFCRISNGHAYVWNII